MIYGVWKIDVWDSVQPLARPSRVVWVGGDLSFATLSPFRWGLSTTVFFCLSRTPKGANQQIKGGSMSTLVDREPNSRREASDVAAQISSPVPGVWFSVPTGDLAIRYIQHKALKSLAPCNADFCCGLTEWYQGVPHNKSDISKSKFEVMLQGN